MKIEVKNLVRKFGDYPAVNDISFELESGNIYGFIGPNGAGKTTTLKIMTTLDSPTSGEILFDGISTEIHPEKIRSMIGFMPDTLPDHGDIRVWEYLDFFARTYKLKGQHKQKVLQELEEFTSLTEIRNKFVKNLSKGMKQRVSLARALVHNPDVLIMDEPAAGLDPRARLELRELLQILAQQGKLIFLSSHILSELQSMCDGAVIIEKGKLLFAGKIDDINNPKTQQNSTEIKIELISDLAAASLKAQEFPLTQSVNIVDKKLVVVIGSNQENDFFNFLEFLIKAECKVTSFNPQRLNLEQIFLNITSDLVQ